MTPSYQENVNEGDYGWGDQDEENKLGYDDDGDDDPWKDYIVEDED